MKIHYLAVFLLAEFVSQVSCYGLQPWLPTDAPPQNLPGGSGSHSTNGVHNTAPEMNVMPDERNTVRSFQQMSDRIQDNDEEGLLKLLGMLQQSTNELEANLAELRAIEDTCNRKVAQAKQNLSSFKTESRVPTWNTSPVMPSSQTAGPSFSFVDSLRPKDERPASRGALASNEGQTMVKPASLPSQGYSNAGPVPANAIAQVDELNSVPSYVQSPLSNDGNAVESSRHLVQETRENAQPFASRSKPASLSLGQSRLFSTSRAFNKRGSTARLHSPSVPVKGTMTRTEQNVSTQTPRNNPGLGSTNDNNVNKKQSSLSEGYSRLFNTKYGSPTVSRGLPGTPKAFVFGE